MHKCVNNTEANVYHLEQVVDNFFPYSQKKLGFNQPVTIIFQSDEDNASKMLGKTAYYNPEKLEVVLYTDNRHPKDVLRSLSHELVHHAQNCRGDFTEESATYEGYAQTDPHLRKMEREAYTKGNLIFRDFEDLIKTGKINIEIDFSESGEPKMSLKEWKNNEINTKLMKKWGYLNESFASEQGAEASFFADEPGEWGADAVEDQPELDFIFSAATPEQKEKFMLVAADVLQAYDKAARADHPEADNLLDQVKQAWLKFSETGSVEEGWGYRDEDDKEEDAGWAGSRRHDDPITALTDKDYEGIGSEKSNDEEGNRPSMAGDVDIQGGRVTQPASARLGKRRRVRGALGSGVWGENANGKISVREAKEITRRIIERIRKEGK
jgi:hypothetical protein